MKLTKSAVLLSVLGLSGIATLVRADAGTPAACAELAATDFSDVQDAPAQVTEAQSLEATEDTPASCRVQGYVAPQVGFEIRLPVSNWNGKLIKIGCGGMCGSLAPAACDSSLRKGYACLVSDMGHKSLNSQGLWAFNNLQAELDFGFRATHVAALIGKVITARYYGRAPARAYFMGCSTGGRQGMVSAQRFPWDFDGVIAGAPPLNYTLNNLNLLWLLEAGQGRAGDRVLSKAAVELMHEAALSQCDQDDGVRDGVIGDPPACHLDLSALTCTSEQRDRCLTSSEVEAARKIYAGLTTSAGLKLYGGAAVGSELNWPNSLLNRDTSGAWTLKGSRIEQFRYMSFIPDAGPGWTPLEVDFDRDYKRLGMTEALYSAANPDLRRFKAAGGKLIVYEGWNDELAVPGPIIDYYETVERTMGGRKPTQDFFRLFMLPGVNHCAGGSGADAMDLLGHLEAWVERGQAPDSILTGRFKDQPTDGAYPYRELPLDKSKLSFTRPAYPYPKRAKYKGSGNPNQAENFRAIEP